MSLGIRQSFNVAANIVVTNSVALVTTTLNVAIAASQNLRAKWFVPFTVGATGGVRAQIITPAAGVLFIAGIKLINTVAPSLTTASQAASAAFTNALANAGTHWLEVDFTFVNGINAGTVDLQMAQNTADANSLTILAGGILDTIFF